MRLVQVRRYRCVACRAVTTVGPAELLTRRLYSASAIAWSLALFGLALLSPRHIRSLVSPWRTVGPTAAARWTTLSRWCVAIADGRLFTSVAARTAQRQRLRSVAEAAAAALAAHAVPSPEPPPLTALAFLGAARAR